MLSFGFAIPGQQLHYKVSVKRTRVLSVLDDTGGTGISWARSRRRCSACRGTCMAKSHGWREPGTFQKLGEGAGGLEGVNGVAGRIR